MCQFWLNESAGTLTSPYFDMYHTYAHNLNCTWMINVKDGFYINLEITSLVVNSLKKTYLQKEITMIFLKMIIIYYSLIWVTLYLFMMYKLIKRQR